VHGEEGDDHEGGAGVISQLAYRCSLLTKEALNSRAKAYAALLKKSRRQRATERTRIRGDDALDEMFRAAGADPADIPRRGAITKRVDDD
jgi:hypothetical protein